MQVNLGNYLVDVEIEYKNNKNMYIRFNNDLKMHVTCNRFVSKNQILKFINAATKIKRQQCVFGQTTQKKKGA